MFFYLNALAPIILFPVTQATDDFAVSWDISDPALDGGVAGSGLATYSVEVCTDGPTNCTNLVANPGTSGTEIYDGQTEHTYTFRVTATDHVDNATTEEQTYNTAAIITKYYLFGGQRVAMRVGIQGIRLGVVLHLVTERIPLTAFIAFTPLTSTQIPPHFPA